MYWIPVGLLEGNIPINIGVHLYTGSRAEWDIVPAHQRQYLETPGFDAVLKILRTGTP